MEPKSTPTKKSWSDADKLALLTAVATSFGPPDWTNIKLPDDRSTLACRKMYAHLIKDGKKWGANFKIRANEENLVSPARTPRKRKRDTDEVAEQDVSDDDEEEVVVAKKVKSEFGAKNDDGVADSDEDAKSKGALKVKKEEN